MAPESADITAMNPRVVGIAGPFQGNSFLLASGEVSIGRDPGNQVCISDKSLSRRHCVIAGSGEMFVVRDLRSRNGTLLNGVPVEEEPLHHGDQISVGESVMVFLIHADETHLERSPVVFADTAELGGSPLVLRQEDAVYLQEKTEVRGLDTARQARDLNALLKISTGIGHIRDRESLQWQLL